MPFCSKRKKRDECTKEELKRTGIRTQVLKLFFHQCVRSEYSDQFRCRLAFPIDRLSLVSNIRAQPKPCNLQLFEIDQGIERSDGQSWKDRVDLPALTKKKTPPPDAEKKRQQSSSAMHQALVCLYFSSFLKKRTGGRQLYRPFLCLAQRQRVASTNGFCSCFSFLFHAEFYAVNS